jgi:hypothetical protein
LLARDTNSTAAELNDSLELASKSLRAAIGLRIVDSLRRFALASKDPTMNRTGIAAALVSIVLLRPTVSLTQELWSIGDPSPHEQLYLEYVNRARADALAESARLRDETDVHVQNAYRFFDVERQHIVEQFNWYVDNGLIDRVSQPLSFQSDLLTAARLHSLDMFVNEFQSHSSSSNPPAPFQPGSSFGDRLRAVGYRLRSAAENVYASARSVAHGHAGFDVDWGDARDPSSPSFNPSFDGQGMQNPAGHRLNVHNKSFKEVGIGVVNGNNGSYGPQIVTQDFGNPASNVSYITGVVYEDFNGNSFYDVGEGRTGVRVDVEGSAFFAVSSESGGYSVPVPQDGIYAVTFSGAGFAPFFTDAVIAGRLNVKVDYLVTDLIELAGDYDGNGLVEQADLDLMLLNWGADSTTPPVGWVNDLPTGLIDQQELDSVLLNWGSSAPARASVGTPSGVPEPMSATLLLIGLTTAAASRARGLR